METVRFTIVRKAAFAGSLLQYHIYINGRLVGTVKNGGTLNAEVPRAGAYYLAGDTALFERNAVIRGRDLPEYTIVLKRAGRWRTESYNEFYIQTGQALAPLPSFHFDRFMHAVFEDQTSGFSPDERLLVRCLEFWYGITDDLQEVLASEHLFEIIDALEEIGAAQFAGMLRRNISELFPDTALPLSDEQLDQMGGRIYKAGLAIWKERSALEEFHRGVTNLVTGKLNSGEYVY